LPSRWILSRLSQAAEEINLALEEYRFNDASNRLYQFLWREFCDWYIELAKTGLEDAGQAKGVRWCLLYVLETVLKLLHPFMPFVTEELWQSLSPAGAGGGSSIMTAAYPRDLPRYPEAEEQMGAVIDAISAVRNIRGELGVRPGAKVNIIVNAYSGAAVETLKKHLPYIMRLAGAGSIIIGTGIEKQKPKKAAVNVMPGLEVYVPVEGLLDIEAEIERLGKELGKTDKELNFCLRKLMDEEFVNKAPEAVVAKERAKCQELEDKKRNLEDSINRLKSMEVENG
ncbi:MAG: class I tRNA ligase family protein, partial [Nitrospiraceae bacterium]|nr:class I tRNA ligase family protein [Nitrospiraceae bacterium]